LQKFFKKIEENLNSRPMATAVSRTDLWPAQFNCRPGNMSFGSENSEEAARTAGQQPEYVPSLSALIKRHHTRPNRRGFRCARSFYGNKGSRLQTLFCRHRKSSDPQSQKNTLSGWPAIYL